MEILLRNSLTQSRQKAFKSIKFTYMNSKEKSPLEVLKFVLGLAQKEADGDRPWLTKEQFDEKIDEFMKGEEKLEDPTKTKEDTFEDVDQEYKDHMATYVEQAALCMFKQHPEEELDSIATGGKNIPLHLKRQYLYFENAIIKRAKEFYQVYNNRLA